MANNKNSLYLSDDMQKYVEEQCELFGMGKSAFISMVLAMYRQQSQAMDGFSKLDEYITRFEKLVDTKESNK
jgi:hypothetical protein